MFKKLISNISNAVLFSVKIMNKNDNVEDVSEFIKSQVFRKAFEFLEEVNFEQHKDIIKNNPAMSSVMQQVEMVKKSAKIGIKPSENISLILSISFIVLVVKVPMGV